MMNLGNNEISKLYLGNTEIKQAYLGNIELMSSLSILTHDTLATGLVSYYKADTSGSFLDSHGNNDGTIGGATYTSEGKINGAYSFDGINDVINLGIGYTNNFTFSLWLTKNNGGIAISQYNSQIKIMSDGRLYGSYYDGGTRAVVTTALVNDNNLHMLTYTKSSTNGVYMYLDGVEVANNTSFTSNLSSGYNSGIGIGYMRNWSSAYYSGIIDEVGIWNRALTNNEIVALYNVNEGLPYNN